jgi:ribosome-associated translation inhibitor RaiA
MRTELFFKDIRHSEYADNFINEKVQILTDKLIHPDNDLHVIVRLEKDRQRTANRHPIYHCEVTLKSGMSAKTYKTVRQDRNLFRAIAASFEALKTILAKTHDRLRNDRRRRRVPEFTTEFSEINSNSESMANIEVFPITS